MKFDASLLVIMVTFWVTYLIVRNFLLKPVVTVVDERQRLLAGARSVYEQALAETGAKIEAERSRLAAARLEARERRDRARKEAREQRGGRLEAARAQAEAELGAARTELADAVRAARQELEGKARELAERMTERLLRKAG